MNSLSSSLAPQITVFYYYYYYLTQVTVSEFWFWQPFHVCDRFKLKGYYIFTTCNAQVIDDTWWLFRLLFQEIRKSKKESKEICFIQFNAFFFWRRWQSPSQRLQKVKRWSLTFWEFRLRWYQARKFNDSESWDDSNIQVGLVRCMMCLLGSATV